MDAHTANDSPPFHPVLRTAAKVVSFVFHPLFIPVYLGWFFIYVLRLFPSHDGWRQTLLLIQFFVNYALLPLVTVLIAKGLGFINSVYLKTQKDRIIPYMATMVFYFWVWYVFKNQGFPKEAVGFALAVFLSTCLGVFFNNYLKVSMHGLSVGVVLTLMVILSLRSGTNFGPYLSIAFLLAGIICTARLITNDHNPKEVYAGLLLGGVAQGAAWVFV